MVEEKSKAISSLTTALPVTALLAGLAALIFSNSLPYQNERPSIPPLKDSFSAYSQDVDARLWQDPFAAVDGVGKESLKEEVSFVSSHGREQIYIDPSFTEAINSSPESKITILAVTLSGRPYQEDAEERMRRRYAVLSALAHQGYTPLDDQHLGYFQPKQKALQKKVPFEWWLPPETDKSKTDKKVLLLWVDESSLVWEPAAKLKALLEQATKEKSKGQFNFNYAVIGPNTSSLLRDMLQEVYRASYVSCTKSNPEGKTVGKLLGEINTHKIVYYSAGATASAESLLRNVEQKPTYLHQAVGKYLADRGVRLYRTTATEQEMMGILVGELKMRRLDEQSDHIVILSESDTFYGRAMPEAFKSWWENDNTTHPFTYMRGLDGKIPDKGDKVGGVAAKNIDSKGKADTEALIEFPEGQSQKDYLRRLTHKILELDQQLKKGQSNQKGVSAIGVLGSDVHDKLLILEALRQHFPHMLFFTTDLNAIYNHPAKWPQSHNLLVASAFDLQLRDELQGPIPPFRDSYQTAFFLATQMMLKNEIGTKTREYKLPPRMFEIGRSRPVPLRTSEESSPNSNLTTNDKNKPLCSWEDDKSKDDNWKYCNKTVHSEISSTFQVKVIPTSFKCSWAWVTEVAVRVLTIALFILLPYIFIWRWRKYMLRKKKVIVLAWKSNHLGVLLCVSALLFLTYVLQQSAGKYFTQYYAEPFYWFQGVSAWPSILLRFIAGVLAIVAFFWGKDKIQKMQSQFQTSHDVNDETILGFNLPNRNSGNIKYFDKYRDVLFVENWGTETVDPEDVKDIKEDVKDIKQVIDPDKLWGKYLYYWHHEKKFLKASTWRAFSHSLAYLVALGTFIYWFGWPNAPMRHDTAYNWHRLSLVFSVIPTVFLTMWVVENARLCKKLIDNLSIKPSSWNEGALSWASHKNVALECKEEWLDIELVYHLTKTIQPLIFWPMLCIGLLAVARSTLIDDWNLPLWLILVIPAMIFYSLTTEFILQLGARGARAKAIKLLTEKIRIQRNQECPNETIITRIEVEIERIRALRGGAFCPWYEWPLVQSFGGLGALIAALKYIPVLMLGGALVE